MTGQQVSEIIHPPYTNKYWHVHNTKQFKKTFKFTVTALKHLSLKEDNVVQSRLSVHYSQKTWVCCAFSGDGDKGDVDMSSPGVNTVQSAAGGSIKCASIILLIHFLSVVRAWQGQKKKGKHSNGVHANLNGDKPPEEGVIMVSPQLDSNA